MQTDNRKINHLNVDFYFNKYYQFKCNDEWTLPKTIFTADKWRIENLQKKKDYLNCVKEELSSFQLEDWSLHTKRRDLSTPIIKEIRTKYQPELLTQAWCKFYEILSKFELISSSVCEKKVLKTFHICEAPGGFISALNHYRNLYHPDIKFDWKASTLNPNYEGNALSEMIPDDRLIKYTPNNWIFGEDLTGDITKFYNYNSMINEMDTVDIVTADGSVDCMQDPGNQEQHVEFLHFCETITALSVLEKDGSFVLKIFTTFEESTICLLYLLNCTFNQVNIFKPITSKSGNSEVYVISQGYKGIDILTDIWPTLLQHYENSLNKSLFDLSDLNDIFMHQIDELSTFFMDNQIRTIRANIKAFVSNKTRLNEVRQLKVLQYKVAKEFFQRYHLERIQREDRIVGDFNITQNSRSYQSVIAVDGYFKYYESRDEKIELNIKWGKQIKSIHHSIYCDRKNLQLINEETRKTESKFKIGRNQLKNSHIVIDTENFDLTEPSIFHKQFLNSIKSVDRNHNGIFLINIPFLSNFLVHALYIFCANYESTTFFNNGYIYLQKRLQNENSECLNRIDAEYAKIDAKFHPNFTYDMLELLDLENINHYFLQCIWYYNNNLIKS